MTKDEFEEAYAEAAGVTVETLHAHGRYAEPCDCGADGCLGWAMGYQWEDAIVEDVVRVSPSERRTRIVAHHEPEPEPKIVEMRGKKWIAGRCVSCGRVRMVEIVSELCPLCR